MAETPSGPIPGSRPVETTPIRIGQARPGMPALQPDRLYPALVVRGGEQPVLRLLGHNVRGEPRHPGLQQGARLLVRPEIQGGRVTLHVMEHSDIQTRVSQRFGRLLHRFPWPLPGGGALPGQTGAPAAPRTAAQPGPMAGFRQAGGNLTPSGATAAGRAAGTGAPGAPAGTGGASLARPGPGPVLVGADGAPARLIPAPRVVEGLWPRAPLQAPQAAGQASGGAAAAVSGRGEAPARTAGPMAQGGGPAAPVPSGLRAALASAQVGGRGGAGGEAAASGLAAAVLSPQGEAQARLSGSQQSVRHWLDALLKPLKGSGGERAEPGGNLGDRLLSEKGRLLLDRWAYIPLPLSGERSGAWVQLQERQPREQGGEPEASPFALRVWLASDHLGGMELMMPLGEGRTWRVRCERAQTVERLEAERPHLERLCRNAGQAMTLRVEGPHPEVGEAPASLQKAATLEQSVSTRA